MCAGMNSSRTALAISSSGMIPWASRKSLNSFSSNASPWWACSFGDSAYYAATNSAPMTGPEWLKLETNWPSIETDVSASLSEDAARLRASLAEQDG